MTATSLAWGQPLAAAGDTVQCLAKPTIVAATGDLQLTPDVTDRVAYSLDELASNDNVQYDFAEDNSYNLVVEPDQASLIP